MFFENPDKLPAQYYSSVRKLLPTQRIAFSEIGWGSESSEDIQARFYARLPELMTSVNPEYVDFALLHDVGVFTGDLATLNSVGFRNSDGTPKKSWDIVKDMDYL